MKADKEEDIYEDLCSFNGRGSKKLQSDVHNFQPKEKRDYILKELLETEFNYVEVILGVGGVTNTGSFLTKVVGLFCVGTFIFIIAYFPSVSPKHSMAHNPRLVTKIFRVATS